MATRFSAAGQGYSKVITLGAQANRTIALWVKIDNARLSDNEVITVDNGAGGWSTINLDSSGTGLYGTDSGGLSLTPTTLTVGTWYYVALVISGTSVTLYSRAAGAPSWTTVTGSGLATFTCTDLWISANVGWLDGAVTGFKFWTAALSQSELDQEYIYHVPSRTANLSMWYPLLYPDTTDWSGNGQTLGGGTGATLEEGPPVPWENPVPSPDLGPAAEGPPGVFGMVTRPATIPQGSDSVWRRPIVIDHTKIDSTLTDFPILVRLTASNFDFTTARPDGFDVRFKDASGNALSFERERHDATAQKAEYHVRVPSISSSVDTTVYAYYGDAGAADLSSPLGVWDTDFIGVWHLGEDPGATIAPQFRDSTRRGGDATSQGGLTTSDSVETQIAKGIAIAGAAKYAVLPSNASSGAATVAGLTAYTVSAWANTTTITNTERKHIIDEARGATSSVTRMSLALETTDKWAIVGRIADADALTVFATSVASAVPNLDTHVVGVVDTVADVHSITVNGTKDSNSLVLAGPIASTAGLAPSTIGTRVTFANEFWNGTISELRISKVARSDAWTKAEYNAGAGTLLTVGTAEPLGLPFANWTQTPVDDSGLTDTAGVGFPPGPYRVGLLAYALTGVLTSSGTTWTAGTPDSVGLTDTEATTFGPTPADSAGLTDTTAFTRSLAPVDSAGLTDTEATSVQPTDVDSTGLTDTSTVALAHLVSQIDSTGLTDAEATAVAPAPSDSTGLTDTTAFTVAPALVDDSGLTDVSTVQLLKLVTQVDDSGLTDTSVVTRLLAPVDSSGLTDTEVTDRAAVVADSSGLTDTFGSQLAKLITQNDSAGLTDQTITGPYTLSEDFESYSLGAWTEPNIYGNWQVAASGNQIINVISTDGDKQLETESEAVGGGGGTFASLVLSTREYGYWHRIVVEYTTTAQFRTPTPNVWECAWVLFDFLNVNHFYSFILKPTAGWELAKEWWDGSAQRQDFLALDATGTWPLGHRLRLVIDQTTSGLGVTIAVTAQDMTAGTAPVLLTTTTDDGTRASGPSYPNGKIGLYTEDSRARWELVTVDQTQWPIHQVDSTGLTDTATELRQHEVPQTDDSGLTDTNAVVRSSVSIDSTGLTDTEITDRQFVVADSTGLTDTTALDRTAVAVDSTGLTDVSLIAEIRAVVSVDDSGLTDVESTARVAVVADDSGLTDVTAKAVASAPVDSAGLTDTSLVESGKLIVQTDSTGLTDATAAVLASVTVDSAGLTDLQSVAVAKATVDLAGLTDTSLVEPTHLLAQTDSTGLTDTTALLRDVAIVDSGGISDSTDVVRGSVPTDSTGLTDVVVVSRSIPVAATDSSGLTDLVSLGPAPNPADSAGLTDTSILQVTRLIDAVDSSGLTDLAVLLGTGVATIPARGEVTEHRSSTVSNPSRSEVRSR